MNKYQEALDKVKSVPLFIEPKGDRNGWKIYLEVSSIEEKNKTDIDVLQELVDKATPKKPIKLEYKILLEDGWSYECPICKCAIGINTKAIDYTQEEGYCPTCGQAIDWSNNED